MRRKSREVLFPDWSLNECKRETGASTLEFLLQKHKFNTLIKLRNVKFGHYVLVAHHYET